MLTGLSLRLRVFLIFAGLAAAILVATAIGLWLGYSRLGQPGVGQGFVQAGVLAGFISRTDILRAVAADPPLDLWSGPGPQT